MIWGSWGSRSSLLRMRSAEPSTMENIRESGGNFRQPGMDLPGIMVRSPAALREKDKDFPNPCFAIIECDY